MDSAHAVLEQMLVFSEAMLISARQGDWDRVAELDGQRQPLLQDAPAPGPQSRDLLERLVGCNAAITELVGQVRGDLAEALGSHTHAHRALRTYVGYAR